MYCVPLAKVEEILEFYDGDEWGSSRQTSFEMDGIVSTALDFCRPLKKHATTKATRTNISIKKMLIYPTIAVFYADICRLGALAVLKTYTVLQI